MQGATCLRYLTFLMIKLLMMLAMVKMARMMVMAPHSQGRRLQDKGERARREKNTRV